MAHSQISRLPLSAIKQWQKAFESGAINHALVQNLSGLKAWLVQGGDIHARGPGGETLLHVLSRLGSDPGVELLLSSGARARMIDDQGKTPLHHLVYLSQSSIQALLLAGASPESLDHKQHSPLMIWMEEYKAALDPSWRVHEQEEGSSSQHHWTQIAELLLKHTRQIDHAGSLGQTLLHHMAEHGVWELLPQVLEKGGSLGLWNAQSQVPRDVLLAHHPELIQAWDGMVKRHRRRMSQKNKVLSA